MSIVHRLQRFPESLRKRLFWRGDLRYSAEMLRHAIAALPTDEMMMAIPVAFKGRGFYESMEVRQNMLELLGLVKRLRSIELNRVCEIGTLRGGTLFVWCQLATTNAQLISIDLPGGGFGGGYHERSLPFFQSFCKAGQNLVCLRGSSHAAETRHEFERTMQGNQLDFLFIDGDHAYEGVKQDFDYYSRWVRKGGFIAFHDIVHRDAYPDIQVPRFWGDVKSRFVAEEFIQANGPFGAIGIGLLQMA